ncbi:MAG: permease [Verrucomicrobiota bacterium]
MSWFSFHISDFAYSFLSILFEGVPFLLLGSVISGAVDVFVPPQLLARLLPKNRTAAVLLSGLLGAVFPMCECGSVIVIRRFLAKGLPVSCAVTYMLGAPIVSPVVALSTFAAFRGQSPWVMTSLRLSLGYLIAVAAGLIVQRLPLRQVLTPKVIDSLPEDRSLKTSGAALIPLIIGPIEIAPKPQSATCAAPDCGCGSQEQFLKASNQPGIGSKLLKVARSSTSDFLDVALFFVIGATIAATFNTAVDQSVIQPLASNSLLATVSMMGLAGALALCSSTDAFIAATFITFPFAAKLAFLVFGPVFDVKLFFLYGLIFRRKFVVLLAIGLFIAIALLCLRMSVLGL